MKTTTKRRLMTSIATVVALALWVGGMVAAALTHQVAAPLTQSDDPREFHAAAAALDDALIGNVAFVLIDDGEVAGEHYASVGRMVGPNTLFQMASVSKWITAWGVMALVEDGWIELDTPVSRYLTRWSLPDSEFDNDGVTVRRLLSHTAGLTDSYGYMGFEDPADVQTLEESLTRTADHAPRAFAEGVRVGLEPGSEFRYSGGGYTILQLLVEEVTGESFNAYMRARVLEPLGMSSSTFVLDAEDEERVADFYAPNGSIAPHFLFTALAAASLYTSADDLTLFLFSHLPGPDGAPAGRGVLRPETLEMMRERQTSRDPAWGLGMSLISTGAEGWLIGHRGGNWPGISTTARIDPSAGDGIIVLSSGDPDLAGRVEAWWHLWRTGVVLPSPANVAALVRRAPWILVVSLVIILGGVSGVVVVGRRTRSE